MRRRSRILSAACLLATAGGLSVPAGAAAAQWTAITSPSGPVLELALDAAGPVHVTGTTSPGLAATLDVYCFFDNDRQVTSSTPLNAAPVAVTGDAFAADVDRPGSGRPCILRAVPHDAVAVDPSGAVTGYAGAFSGPAYYPGSIHLGGGTTYLGFVSAPRGVLHVTSIDLVGIQAQQPFDTPTMTGGPPAAELALELGRDNLPAKGETASRSGIVVDGHNAYPPHTAALVGDGTVTPPQTTVTFGRDAGGAATIVEVDPLSRCAGDPYPVANGTCALQPTGVTLRRTIRTALAGEITYVRDRLLSTDGLGHVVDLEEGAFLPQPGGGEPGYRLPGQTGFHVSTGPTAVHPLAAGTHSILTTTDVHATDGYRDRTDAALTYSGAPAFYFTAADHYGMRFHRVVPAGGWSGIGFGITGWYDVPDVQAAATSVERELTGRLTIAKPHAGAAAQSPVRVAGHVGHDANGLPAKVTVSSGSVTKNATVGADGSYSTRLHLTPGTRTITVTAVDPGGATLTRHVHITVR